MCKVKQFVINNQFGLHARPATKFVSTVAESECEVEVTNLTSGHSANGRSIISMLMLNAPKGTKIKLEVTGKDQDKLIDALTSLIENNFDQ